eukprot:150111-Lingulodinium_polyedra.AAC.1
MRARASASNAFEPLPRGPRCRSRGSARSWPPNERGKVEPQATPALGACGLAGPGRGSCRSQCHPPPPESKQVARILFSRGASS